MSLRDILRGVNITASPERSLVDEKIEICVTGLWSGQPVTLVSVLKENDKCHLAYGHYISDEGGRVHVSTMISSGGTYSGCEPMGLFWSLVSEDGTCVGVHRRRRDVRIPYHFNIYVLASHINVDKDVLRQLHGHEDGQNLEGAGILTEDVGGEGVEGKPHCQVLARTSAWRYFLSPDVIRAPVRHGRLRGVLFIPKGGDGRHPGVIDMYGASGGVVEYRAALLASRGFTTLALPYMRYQDLPTSASLQFEYFEEAVEWLSQHPNVLGEQLGVIGTSLGADIAFKMAQLFKKVKAVTMIGGRGTLFDGVMTYRGRPLETAAMNVEKVIQRSDGWCLGRGLDCWDSDLIAKGAEEAQQAEFLLIQGTDDQSVDARHSLSILQYFMEHNLHNLSLHLYGGAGHIIDPPYLPLSNSFWHEWATIRILLGGKEREQSVAQEDSWTKILNFFHRLLSVQNTIDLKNPDPTDIMQQPTPPNEHLKSKL